ncbi:hypothetical protein DFA_03873 [Cavenderia fasciculata]|uniref:Uncharacterized protein n=1 Tax=Cavenderia fasciculata TaxID=261658 RepID=F4Q0M8_CACFS|nr:uncharacterized protein DFA_03873 [Cavenderia fasciculata]EGG18379.1 hypothetical protein DFA_03873 [Cavenderia fasciculata]|eukprot:XP_004366283.1 hypothetical protein DFA_03873 [Cavenderia fasciculata]
MIAQGIDQQHLNALKESNVFNNVATDAQRKIDEYVRGVIDEQGQTPIPPVERGWKKVGTVKDIDSVMEKYPVTKYKYGSSYNTKSIESLVVSTWNRGLRITHKKPYVMGDNATDFQYGFAGWTFGIIHTMLSTLLVIW